MIIVKDEARQKLVKSLESLSANPSGWVALHLNTSDLSQDKKYEIVNDETVLKLSSVVNKVTGRVFIINDSHLIVLYGTLQNELKQEIKHELSDILGADETNACFEYDLAENMEDVLQMSRIGMH